MNDILFVIVVLILFVSTFAYQYIMIKKNNHAEIERLREVVRALKSKDVQEYENVLPPLEDKRLPEQKEDELIPLEEVDPEQLLKQK